MTEYSCAGYTDDGSTYDLITCGAVTLIQAIEQFKEFCGTNFEVLVCCNFECIDILTD
jgi:DNA-directed RNA polymerase specialized sigma subunit|tara:strand:+ start:268 stop:441 length:174 start_codon:yes stop_codon:yes gene_type:complete